MAATLHLRDYLRLHWQALRRGEPGRRFSDRYECARRERGSCGVGVRVALVAAAAVSLAIAVVLSVFPGPALPFYFLAGGLLATESRTIARAMDWTEVRARRIAAWGKRRWRRLPVAARVALLAVGAACSAGTAYLTWRWLH